MAPKDARRIPGTLVEVRVMVFMSKAECGRRYGSNKATKVLCGRVLSCEKLSTSSSKTSQTLVTIEIDLGEDKRKIFTTGLRNVRAHHQNGISERAIHTVSESARAMLLHAAIHWPKEISLDLWPLAMDYAIWIWNRMPRKESGLAPVEIFCGATVDKTILRNTHVFGCPAYVLDPKIQDGKKLPRWQPKSCRGQFLGFSKRHACTIGLIWSLKTGSISPQFHAVFDDQFTTIPSRLEDDQIDPEVWIDLLQFSRLRVIDDEDEGIVPNNALGDEWLSDEERQLHQQREQLLQCNQNIPAGVPFIDPEEQQAEDD
jgi:hypothetical protein